MSVGNKSYDPATIAAVQAIDRMEEASQSKAFQSARDFLWAMNGTGQRFGPPALIGGEIQINWHSQSPASYIRFGVDGSVRFSSVSIRSPNQHAAIAMARAIEVAQRRTP